MSQASCVSYFTSLFTLFLIKKIIIILLFCLFDYKKAELFLCPNLSNKVFIIFVYYVQFNL